jgi:hypothetical protein
MALPPPTAPSPSIFLYGLGRPLLVLHALCALTLCGTSVHQAVYALRALVRPFSAARLRRCRLFSRLVLLSYLAVVGLGALMYPRYRYFVRGLYLDRYAPWASNLFDFKENLATVGLPFAIAAFFLARALAQQPTLLSTQDPDAGPLGRRLLALYAMFAVGIAVIVTFNSIAGLLVASVRGI